MVNCLLLPCHKLLPPCHKTFFEKFGDLSGIQYVDHMDVDAFWKRIKLLIKKKAVTQSTAALACDIPPATLRQWMTRSRPPPITDAYNLAQYLGVSLDYLITGKNRSSTLGTNEAVLKMLQKASEKLLK